MRFSWLIPMVFVILAFVMIGELQGRVSTIEDKAPIIKVYEDHSAFIKYDGVTCTIPAYDSPQDKITCKERNQP